MEYRIEHDSMGEVHVPANHSWGAVTQRSLSNFMISQEIMPEEIVHALIEIKRAAAIANHRLGVLSENKKQAIVRAADVILGNLNNMQGGESSSGFRGGVGDVQYIREEYTGEFPLSVWQTGSGTQTNMNVNEVLAHIGGKLSGGIKLHPNDDINKSQSSNDVFPSAMHIAALIKIKRELFPAIKHLIDTLIRLESENQDIIKMGRTHLQDAVPIGFSQEISAWRAMLEQNLSMLGQVIDYLRKLAMGGTAVGTGINCPEGFDLICVQELSNHIKEEFGLDSNKFHALTSKDAYVYVHGALKSLACNLMKMANDVRWLASGPRGGIGEIEIPANEPGSSIMPCKVNPTQCEAVTMVAVQVMGNDATIGIAASQGNFELNVYMPVMAYNMLQSVGLLAAVIQSFDKNCVAGIKANQEKMSYNLDNSLMTVTYLAPSIGYENAAKVAKQAYERGATLREIAVDMGFMTEEAYDVCMEKINKGI